MAGAFDFQILHRQEAGPNFLLVREYSGEWKIVPKTRISGGNADEEPNYWYTHIAPNSPVAAGEWMYWVGGTEGGRASGITVSCRK